VRHNKSFRIDNKASYNKDYLSMVIFTWRK